MLLRRGLAASALLLTTVCAQSSTTSADQTVITVFMIGAAGGGPEDDPTNLYASIIDNDDTATTMKIGCDDPKSPDEDICNYFSGFEVINGPSTFRAGYEYNEGTMTMGCDITDSTTAICSQTMIAPAWMMEEDGPEVTTNTDLDTTRLTSSTTTTTIPSSDITYYPVTITAGALKTGSDDDTASSTAGASAASSSAGSGDVSDARRVTLKTSGGLAGFVALVMMAL